MSISDSSPRAFIKTWEIGATFSCRTPFKMNLRISFHAFAFRIGSVLCTTVRRPQAPANSTQSYSKKSHHHWLAQITTPTPTRCIPAMDRSRNPESKKLESFDSVLDFHDGRNCAKPHGANPRTIHFCTCNIHFHTSLMNNFCSNTSSKTSWLGRMLLELRWLKTPPLRPPHTTPIPRQLWLSNLEIQHIFDRTCPFLIVKYQQQVFAQNREKKFPKEHLG